MKLQLPHPSHALEPSSVFTQAGAFVCSGSHEHCELKAEEIGGLYCWNAKSFGRLQIVVRRDYYPLLEDTSGILEQVKAKFDEVGDVYDEDFLNELECSFGGISLYRFINGWEVRKELMTNHEKILGTIACKIPKELMWWREV